MARGQGDGFRKCVRFAMVIANLLILAGALAILGVGIWTIVDKSYLEILLRNQLYMTAAYTLVAVGTITIILSIFGCMGSLKEKRILLLAYFIFVLLMFVVLLIGGVLAYIFRFQIASTLRPEMLLAIREYKPATPNDAITKAWDATQEKLECCGIETRETIGRPWAAWNSNKHINSGSADKKVPKSCCKLDTNGTRVDCSTSTVDVNMIFTSDCFGAALVFVKDHTLLVGGVAIGISTIMILGMVFSVCHYKLISRSTE
jgi:tetraspanin-11